MSQFPERVRALTDFEGSDYLRYPLPHAERVKHLESWLREALIIPFAYDGVVDQNGSFVSHNQKIAEINERAVQVREGQVGEARVRAEFKGIIRLEALLNNAEVGDVLFLFSPPGSTEEGFGAGDLRRLSFTYIFEVGKGVGDNKKSVRAIAIPSPEISPITQLQQFTDIFADIDMLTYISPSEKLIDRKLVASPILVSGLRKEEREGKLDRYVNTFIGKSWDELEKVLESGLKLRNDEHAEKRRKSLIQSISWQIRRYVDEGDGARLNNIGEAARVVMAREASGHYLGMTPTLLLVEYRMTESAMWLQMQYQLADENEKQHLLLNYGAQLGVSERHLRDVREAILNDPNAIGMLQGSACGGGGLGDAMSGMSGRFGQMMMGRGHLLERQLEAIKNNASESSSSSEMKCVTCPFCSALVDAIVTSDKIQCPKCLKTASRG